MELCILTYFWLLLCACLVVGYILDQHPRLLPIIPSLFRWGKMRIGYVDPTKKFYEVPKRWYQHFYIVGTVVNGFALLLVLAKLFLGYPFPSWLASFLQWLQYPVGNTGYTNAAPVLAVLVMDQLQVMRRCYETFFINIFSEAATMTLLHYILGLIFYTSFALTVLSGVDFNKILLPDSLTTEDIVVYCLAVAVYLLASRIQHQTFKNLASLRTNKKDAVQHAGYILPHGGLFEYVSCPHFLAEMVIYISFNAVFRFSHPVLLSLGAFVLVNQSLASIISHQWYIKNFPNYPTQRRAVVPFIY